LSPEQILLLPLWYVVFLLAVTCHEGAHALAAHRGGDPTAYLGGQVSLNPLPHILREPIGTVVVPLVSYFLAGWMIGWASAPYDPYWEQRHPRRAAGMAAAGPLANLLLAALGFAVLKIGLTTGTWSPPISGDYYEFRFDRLVVPTAEGAAAIDALGRLCSILLSLNLVLFLFNLIPLPPMDGSAVLSGLFEPFRRLRDRMREVPMMGLLGLLIAWKLFGFIFVPVYTPIVMALYP
jgi:Zn-dependent protease